MCCFTTVMTTPKTLHIGWMPKGTGNWHLVLTTFSEGPGGEHQMDICGEGRQVHRSHLMQLAQKGGIDPRWAQQRLDAMLEVVDHWDALISAFDIRLATRQKMKKIVLKQRDGLS